MPTYPIRLLLALVILCAALLALCAGTASAAVSCPNANPIVNENNCEGAGSTAWQISDGDPNGVAGFAVQPSVNLGQSVQLKIGAYESAGTKVNLSVFRMGYYGGKGGRLVYTANNVAVDNGLGCNPMNETTGEVNCNNWDVTYTIPGSSLPMSGVYIVTIKDTKSTHDNQIVFVVREDSSKSEMLVKVPTASYQAYNFWGDKSLYDNNSQGEELIPGHPRALAVSFERPLQDVSTQANYFLHDEFALIYWMEKQGYDISYTDSTAIAQNPSSLLSHKVLVIGGHDEYWSAGELAAVKAAREAGVSIASFSANTSYWKVDYENNFQTIASYKTVQDGSLGRNDKGAEGPTSSFRDPGAPAGSPNAPKEGRPAINKPENSLWGIMYIGDNDDQSYPLVVPPANSQDEFAGDRIWRNTGINPATGATIGTNLVGWEWDAVPNAASPLYDSYLGVEPAGVAQLTQSPVTGGNPEFLQDAGMTYGASPPPGQPGYAEAVKYRAPSGALVFAAGTIQWPWGLGPHFINTPGSEESYMSPAVNTEDPRIEQATYNIFSDMGVQPATPVGITLDPNPNAPQASFTASPTTVVEGSSIAFNGSASSSPEGTIVNYTWDLDGSGKFATNTGTTATVSHTYSTPGTVTVSLRVTDSKGLTATATRTVTVLPPPTVYASAVESTLGVQNFWQMNDPAGSGSFIDAVGGDTAQASSGVTLGVAGGLLGESTVASFDGASGSAQAPLNLTADSQITVEFWLKWKAFGNDDHLAMEFTPNFNSNAGGFLVDPDAPEQGGEFAFAIGQGASRNNVYFPRPSAEQWHYYAFTINTAAAGASEITPYVDGKAVAYTKTAEGTGAGNFASSTLYWMSRDASTLFGAGSMQDLAIYNTSLPSATITKHYQVGTGTLPNGPAASFTATPAAVPYGGSVSFNGAASTSTNGAIVDYRWDLNGSGEYATNTGTTATVSHSYTTPGPVTVGLEVTDAAGKTATTTRTIYVGAATTSSYDQDVLGTAGLQHFWPLGDPAGGSVLTDASGSSPASVSGGATLGQPGALSGEKTTSTSFDGNSGAAQAEVNLSQTHTLTVEFWMKWSAYANDDQLAMEFTPNFNSNAGGFLVDPDAPELGGEFGFGIGQGASRNNVYFPRPSAGQWHYYAFTIDTSAAGKSEITPYVDGSPVTYTKTAEGTGAGNFASSSLYWFSRDASSLFGPGSMQNLAIYNQVLSANTILEHYDVATGVKPPPPPTATPYAEAVLGTSGVQHLWTMGEPIGASAFSDSIGGDSASIVGGVALGQPGALSGEKATSASFDGASGAAHAEVNLSQTSTLTVEFWMKWSAYANDDQLAMEFTPNFNSNAGGFLVDPNAGELGGEFGVGIGEGASRNTVYFERPSAGQWHYYAFVINTAAPGASEITPYVDGKPVAYTKTSEGTGAGNFANSSLYWFSRDASSLFGAGSMQYLALYNQALPAATILTHYQKGIEG
jgi:PKD repeat protein